jgi:hypothetical protein
VSRKTVSFSEEPLFGVVHHSMATKEKKRPMENGEASVCIDHHTLSSQKTSTQKRKSNLKIFHSFHKFHKRFFERRD